MVIILVDEITNRLSYSFDFIFKSRGVDFEFTTDLETFKNSSLKKLNYSNIETNEVTIIPSSLLFETDIENHHISRGIEGDFECLSFDKVTDLVASVFYILTRYEEYNNVNKDIHGRFPFTESCLSKYDWVEQAVCDRWATDILLKVGEKAINNRTGVIPTFDIDNTYAYRLKKGKQKYLSIARDIIRLDFNRLKERRKVSKGGVDPYDTFDKIKKIAKRFPRTKIFWLIGERAEKDRNIPLSQKEHQVLIKEMNEVVEVNLHPSFASNGQSSVLGKEKKSLEKVLKKSISNSRQHFLRFQLPETFQSLQKIGFTHEYSMGFAESVGFRCGTARSHYWFDLSINKMTDFTIHPFVYMDGTLNEYMHLTISESKDKIQELYNEVCEYGGEFIFLWHNETIGNYKKWKGWSEVLDFTLNLKNE